MSLLGIHSSTKRNFDDVFMINYNFATMYYQITIYSIVKDDESTSQCRWFAIAKIEL